VSRTEEDHTRLRLARRLRWARARGGLYGRYQSLLFNEAATHRLKQNGLAPIEGDLVLDDATQPRDPHRDGGDGDGSSGAAAAASEADPTASAAAGEDANGGCGGGGGVSKSSKWLSSYDAATPVRALSAADAASGRCVRGARPRPATPRPHAPSSHLTADRAARRRRVFATSGTRSTTCCSRCPAARSSTRRTRARRSTARSCATG